MYLCILFYTFVYSNLNQKLNKIKTTKQGGQHDKKNTCKTKNKIKHLKMKNNEKKNVSIQKSVHHHIS